MMLTIVEILNGIFNECPPVLVDFYRNIEYNIIG
jgi:hypothetical protein